MRASILSHPWWKLAFTEVFRASKERERGLRSSCWCQPVFWCQNTTNIGSEVNSWSWGRREGAPAFRTLTRKMAPAWRGPTHNKSCRGEDVNSDPKELCISSTQWPNDLNFKMRDKDNNSLLRVERVPKTVLNTFYIYYHLIHPTGFWGRWFYSIIQRMTLSLKN